MTWYPPGCRTEGEGDAHKMSRHEVRVRRVYGSREPEDGRRVLVDRVWPRGVSKERADLDEWCKAVAPSPALRTWYGHDPDRFSEFDQRYRSELEEAERAVALQHLIEEAERQNLTLLTSTSQPEISQAAVLAEIIRRRPGNRQGKSGQRGGTGR